MRSQTVRSFIDEVDVSDVGVQFVKKRKHCCGKRVRVGQRSWDRERLGLINLPPVLLLGSIHKNWARQCGVNWNEGNRYWGQISSQYQDQICFAFQWIPVMESKKMRSKMIWLACCWSQPSFAKDQWSRMLRVSLSIVVVFGCLHQPNYIQYKTRGENILQE